MRDEVIAVYEKEGEIKKIIEKLREYSFDNLVKTEHFEYSVLEKGTNINLLEDKFKEFERIKIIVKRKHETSDKITYDFYYELNDGTYILYAIALDEPKPILINAFHIERNLKRFKRWLVNEYKNQLIS